MYVIMGSTSQLNNEKCKYIEIITFHGNVLVQMKRSWRRFLCSRIEFLIKMRDKTIEISIEVIT